MSQANQRCMVAQTRLYTDLHSYLQISCLFTTKAVNPHYCYLTKFQSIEAAINMGTLSDILANE